MLGIWIVKSKTFPVCVKISYSKVSVTLCDWLNEGSQYIESEDSLKVGAMKVFQLNAILQLCFLAIRKEKVLFSGKTGFGYFIQYSPLLTIESSHLKRIICVNSIIPRTKCCKIKSMDPKCAFVLTCHFKIQKNVEVPVGLKESSKVKMIEIEY